MTNGIHYRQPVSGYFDPYRVYLPPAKLILFALIGCFLVLAPLSVSGGASQDDALKWARVANLGLLTLVGLQFLRVPRQADISGRLLLFGLVFWISALWSDSVLWGLAFKSMFFASLLAGIAIGNAIQTETEFRGFARVLTAVSLLSLLLIIYVAATSTSPLFWNGRLQIWRINSNLLAQSGAVFAILSLFHLAIRDRPVWMAIALFQVFAMVSVCVLTGSRGAILMIAAGVCIFLPTLTTKLRTLIITGVVAAMALALISYSWTQFDENYVDSGYQESGDLRIVAEATRDTRFEMWGRVVKKVHEEPMVRCGVVASWKKLVNGAVGVLAGLR